MILTVNNQPVDDIYTLTDGNGQKYNIHASALNAKNLKITAPDGTIIENPSAELLQQMRDYIAQINQNKIYVDAQGEAILPQQRQAAEIKPAEDVSAPVNAVNQYFRRLNYDLANNNVPSGWYTLPAIGLTATGVGAAMSAPIMTAATMAGGWLGGNAVDTGIELATGKSWAKNMSDWTGLDAVPAELTNPGMWIGGYQIPKYGTNVLRRGVETAMRTSPVQNGLTTVWDNTRSLLANKDYQRMRAIGKYIFTGKSTGNKGYYNSLRTTSPEENYYSGFDWVPEDLRGKNDIIDAFLYKKEVDPGFGLYRKATGEDFGTHADYVTKNYSGKAKDIQVYGTAKTEPSSDKIKVTGSKGVDSEIETAENIGFDAAGHRQIYGTDASGKQYTMEQDIWKFKPKEYMKKWLSDSEDAPLWKRALLRTGLEATDYVGTPVIVRTPWQRISSNIPPKKKVILPGELSKINIKDINVDDLLKIINEGKFKSTK